MSDSEIRYSDLRVATALAVSDPQGAVAVRVICPDHQQVLGIVRQDLRFYSSLGFVVRMQRPLLAKEQGRRRGSKDVIAFITDPRNPHSFHFRCARCGELRNDPKEMADALFAFLGSGRRRS